MCNLECLDFITRALPAEEVTGRRIIDVGSRNINGSARPILEPYAPATYVGVDMESGPSVDVVMDAADLLKRFEPGSFDIVVSTEMVEHVRDWRTVLHNLKTLCAPGGVVLITTRSRGFRYHGWPHDYWRFEPEDMAQIFADFEIEMLESDDPTHPGVFIKARRNGEVSADLSTVPLFSMVTRDRRRDITDRDVLRFRFRKKVKPLTRKLRGRLGRRR